MKVCETARPCLILSHRNEHFAKVGLVEKRLNYALFVKSVL